MLPDLHTNFSRGRSGGLVFPSLSLVILACNFLFLCVLVSLSGFGIRVMVALWNEFGNFPSSVTFCISSPSLFTGKFQLESPQIYSHIFSFLLFIWDPIIQILVCLMLSQRSLRLHPLSEMSRFGLQCVVLFLSCLSWLCSA